MKNVNILKEITFNGIPIGMEYPFEHAYIL